MGEEHGALLDLESTLLADLEELDSPGAYRGFRDRLRHLDFGVLDSTGSRASTWLCSAVSRDELDFEQLAEDLDDQSRLGRAAAFCLVERFGDRPEVLEGLILGLSPYEAPKVGRSGTSHVIHLMGLSGKSGLIPLLERILRENYHHHAPSWTAQALENLGVETGSLWPNRDRSITVSQSGSSIIIHHDSRFSGSSNCPNCEFFPCRINHYYRGAIEDCKLWRKISPETLLEIVDYRKEAERGSTVDASEAPEAQVREACSRAEALAASGELREAAEAWRMAARHATGPDEQLRWITRAMRTMVRAGDRPAAYALTTLAEDKARAAEDEKVIRRWERTRLGLQEELGVYVASQRDQYRTARGRLQADLLARFRRGPGRDPKELAAAAAMGEQYLLQAGGDEWLRYRWQSYLLSTYRTLACPDLAENMFHRTVPHDVADDATKDAGTLGRAVLAARHELYFGEARSAIEQLERLLPRIRANHDPDRRLEYLGYVAEAVATTRKWTFAEALSLIREMRQLYVDLLTGFSSAPSRKRLRERHQRTLECAVRLSAGYAESSGGAMEAEGLAEIWRLIVATRNPELQRARLMLDTDQARRLRSLEDSLHRGLYYYQIEGSERAQFVESFLRRVVDYEVAHVRRERRPVSEGEGLGSADQCLLWFAFGELAPLGTYLLLIRERETCRAVWLRDCDDLFEQMAAWQQYTEKLALRGAGDLRCYREVYSARAQRQVIEKPDEALVHEAVSRLLAESPATDGASSSRDLYPDGPLYTLPIEALPDPARPGFYLGERLATRYCLRPRPHRGAEEMLSLRKGWIGLGGIPAPRDDIGRFAYLPGTRWEVEALAHDLSHRGTSVATCLTYEEAHLENLVDALEKHRPSVLHLAAHGIGDPEYPDACSLVLAVEPGGAAAELLPFRLIRDLPVDGLELAVLSACWSLVGPVGLGTGIEGLAWALLDAGVDHVLASRYPVSDHHTVAFMRCFYEHLFEHPPAEALRRARIAAHRSEGVPLRELGAWALWC